MSTITVNLRKILHRRLWESVSMSNVSSGTNSFTSANTSTSILTQSWLSGQWVLGIGAATLGALFSPESEGFLGIPSGALASVSVGTCGCFHPNGPTGTASAGTLSSLTTALTLPGNLSGMTIRLTGGTGKGQEAVIDYNTPGANSIITVRGGWVVAPDNTTTYQLVTGRWYIWGGTGTFKYYDFATSAWSAALATASGPSTIQVGDQRLVATPGFARDMFACQGPIQALQTGTASAGSTTGLTSSGWTVNQWMGWKVGITSGTGKGQVASIDTNTTTDLLFGNTLGVALDNTSVYYILRDLIDCGKATGAPANAGNYGYLQDTAKSWTVDQVKNYVLHIVGGTGAGQYRPIIGNSKTVLKLAGQWGVVPDNTSQYLIEPPGPASIGIASGLATAGAASTITNGATGIAWTVDQWKNFQIRLTGGTGAGQIRTISSNTATVITTSAVWTTQPDNTTTYVIEGNDDFLYACGANATGLERYSISGNTWSAMTARGTSANSGCSLNWVAVASDQGYANENAIINGRRLFSLRGANSNALDYYDIGANSWTNGAAYLNQNDVFGSVSHDMIGGQVLYLMSPVFGSGSSEGARSYALDFVNLRMDPFVPWPVSNGSTSSAPVHLTFGATFREGTTIQRWLYQCGAFGTSSGVQMLRTAII